jgi:DNA methylase
MTKLNARFLEAVHSREPVEGYTHDFYRYPARFSPLFVREAIRTFSGPGDCILDPFMGGGTSLVEASLQGRVAIGSDISSLSVFLAQVKTALMSSSDLRVIRTWADSLDDQLNLRNATARDVAWICSGYQRNISSKNTWPMRKTLELGLATISELKNEKQKRFARCALLKTAQWALDCRSSVPHASEVRVHLKDTVSSMVAGAVSFATAIGELRKKTPAVCLHRSAVGLENDSIWADLAPPKLIITSPPYPGVHVLYHRWQVQGRRETPAPFWIAGTQDGQGASFYTFGDRKQHNLTEYFDQVEAAFRSLAFLSDRRTVVIQMVAFSNPSLQLPRYLDAMANAGLVEIKAKGLSNSDDGRIWRAVPNRKWYASQRGEIGASKEVVLFHRKRT